MKVSSSIMFDTSKQSNASLQLRRAISIHLEGTKLLERHAIAPSAARLCYPPSWLKIDSFDRNFVATVGVRDVFQRLPDTKVQGIEARGR